MNSYQIVLSGHADHTWAERFEVADLAHLPDGSSLFVVELPDQSALMGLLLRLHNMGIQLVGLMRMAGEV
jgi:hypothetical protein